MMLTLKILKPYLVATIDREFSLKLWEQLVLLSVEMTVPPASWTSFPALPQRWLSPLLAPRCASRVKNLYVLVSLILLAALSTVGPWRPFPLSFCDITHFWASRCFSGHPLLALFLLCQPHGSTAILQIGQWQLFWKILLIPAPSLFLALRAHLPFWVRLTLTSFSAISQATPLIPLLFLFFIALTPSVALCSLLNCCDVFVFSERV